MPKVSLHPLNFQNKLKALFQIITILNINAFNLMQKKKKRKRINKICQFLLHLRFRLRLRI